MGRPRDPRRATGAKLLLPERCAAVPCCKVIAVIDHAAIARHRRAWVGEFAKEFGFEAIVLAEFEARHEAMCVVQARQRR